MTLFALNIGPRRLSVHTGTDYAYYWWKKDGFVRPWWHGPRGRVRNSSVSFSIAVWWIGWIASVCILHNYRR